MELVIALAVGVGIGWLLGHRRAPGEPGREAAPVGRRPTRKQRQILATLPPDPRPPTIEELVAEELEATGAAEVPGAERLPPEVALKVFTRDRPVLGAVPVDRLRFVVDAGVAAAEATADQVRLEEGGEQPPAGPTP